MAAKECSSSLFFFYRRKLTINEIVLYIVPDEIRPFDLALLKNQARHNNYKIVDLFCEEVTHILAELKTLEEILQALDNHKIEPNVETLSTRWLTDSIKDRAPITDDIRLSTYEIKSGFLTSNDECIRKRKIDNLKTWIMNACKGKCLLNHENPELVDVLNLLIRYAKYKNNTTKINECNMESTNLKSVSYKIENVHELAKLHRFGRSIGAEIKDILEVGSSKEVEDIKQNEQFNVMELFTGVYGIGPINAEKLYNNGHRTIDDLRAASGNSPLLSDNMIACGLGFYEDLKSMTRADADQILAILQNEVDVLRPGNTIVLVGGFRRGKSEDDGSQFLVTLPEPQTFVSNIVQSLYKQNICLCSTILKAQDKIIDPNIAKLNSWVRCFMVLRCPTGGRKWSEVEDCDKNYKINGFDEVYRCHKLSQKPRQWKAVRVELVICEAGQFAYALVKLTGSNFFNSCLGMYANANSNMSLYANGLWDKTRNVLIPAANEREVFANLQLDYLEPWERNM